MKKNKAPAPKGGRPVKAESDKKVKKSLTLSRVILDAACKKAAETGTSFSAIVEKCMREHLNKLRP